MNKKIHKMLLIFLNTTEPISSHFIANELGVTSRTVKRYVKELPKSIKDIDINIGSNKNGYKIIIDDINRVRLLNILKATPLKKDALLGSIYIYLILYENVTLDDLSNHLFFSKSIIIKKVNDLKNELKNFNLDIESSNKGLCIKGNESYIRNAFNYYFDVKSINDIVLLEKFIGVDNLIVDINELIISELKLRGLFFSEEHISLITKTFVVSIVRYKFKSDEQFEKGILIYKNFITAQNIMNLLKKKFGLHINDSDLLYISVLLGDVDFNKRRNIELKVSMLKVLKSLDLIYNESFSENESFIKNLQKHLLLSLQRITINRQINNPLKEIIKKKYYLSYEYATSFANELEMEIGLRFTEEDISYFTLHFQTYVEQKDEEKKYRIIVVCENGIGTSSLVKMQLESRFSNLYIESIMPSYLLDKSIYKDIDFIISTQHLSEEINKKIIFVNPILAEEDFLKINNYLKNSLSSQYINNLFDPQFCKIDVSLKNREEFFDFLKRIFNNDDRISPSQLQKMRLREEKVPTDIVKGFAFPHFISTKKSFFVFIKLNEEIQWADEKVSFVFVGGINPHDNEGKKIFPFLIKKIQDGVTSRSLLKLNSLSEFFEIINKG